MNKNDLFLKAQFFFQNKDFQSSKRTCLQILRKSPSNHEVLNLLAFIELELKNHLKALDYLRKSLAFNPMQPNTLSNIALAHMEIGELESSIKYFKSAIKINQENPTLYFNLGRIYFLKNDYDNAKLNYQKAIIKDKNFYKARLNYGFVLNKECNYSEALTVFEELVKDCPTYFEANLNLAITYDNSKLYEKAIIFYHKAINLEPENQIAKFNLSCLYLHQNNFSQGWSLYDSRWYKLKKPSLVESIPPCNEFDKQKNLLIWAEQGIGDQILFSSMLSDLDKKNSYTILLDPRLVKIYERSFPDLSFISFSELSNLSKFSCQLPIGDLGKFLRKSNNSFSQKKGFLKPNLDKSKYFHNLFKNKKQTLCGISWKSKNNEVGDEKSLYLEQLMPVLSQKNIDFIDLQYGDTEKELKILSNKYNIKINVIDDLDKFNDIDSLASLIFVCNYVVTTSSVTAHIAGALGKKTFLLIPYAVGSLWYWGDDNKCLWYPSISIYRQKKPNDWSEPINEIAKKLIPN